MYAIARAAGCLRCYYHLASIQLFARAVELADARGVARAMLIDAAAFRNEGDGFECRCGQKIA